MAEVAPTFRPSQRTRNPQLATRHSPRVLARRPPPVQPLGRLFDRQPVDRRGDLVRNLGRFQFRVELHPSPVRTQPGVIATIVIDCALNSAAMTRVSMFNAALDTA